MEKQEKCTPLQLSQPEGKKEIREGYVPPPPPPPQQEKKRGYVPPPPPPSEPIPSRPKPEPAKHEKG